MARNNHYRSFVIVNPASAEGSTGREWPKIQEALKDALQDKFTYQLTSGPLQATELTRKALKDGYEMIVSVGGDGTNNEIINGFFDTSGKAINPKAVLGIIPSGTGGDFRKSIGLGTNIQKNIATLKGRKTRQIDLGQAQFIDHHGKEVSRHFLNIASFGISGEIDNIVNNGSKKFGGRITFFYACTRAVLTWKHPRVLISLDGAAAKEYYISHIDVANGQFFGGGLQCAPHASLDDGYFDVAGFLDIGRITSFFYTCLAYKGKTVGLPKTIYYKAKTVTATSDEQVLIDIDGEQPGQLPATFTLHPGALRLKVK